MKSFEDCFGVNLRLTEERRTHIAGHPEMRGLEDAIESALVEPTFVRRSRSDGLVRLYYRYLEDTAVGGKWLCVVAKCEAEDGFIITAYLTDRPKTGEDLWPVI